LKRSPELSLRRDGVRALGAIFAVLIGPVLALPTARAAPSALPDRPAAAALLEQFKQSVWSEPLYAEFDLIQMPRRGDERVFHGRFWGSRNERGPVTRFEMETAKGVFAHHILVQGGHDGGIWASDGAVAGAPAEAAMMAPLVPGVEMTPFDILPMPYLYWLDAELVSENRIRGRTAFTYLFTPDAEFSGRNPSVKSVRAYLDTQYDALVQSEVNGPAGVSKTLSLLELRKVGNRWIPKDMDVRNEATRDKTRLSLTAVAIGAEGGPAAFDPALLGSPLAPPPAASVIRVEP
jgi:hypothetical protein